MTPRLKGILLMAAAMACFASLDTMAKHVMLELPAVVAVFFRYGLALLLTLAIIGRAGGPVLMTTSHPWLQVARGLLLVTSTWLNFFAISYLQLAQTAAIFFTVPLWVCALSVPLLKEAVGIRRWMAVVFGFLGAVIVMRPGTADFHPAMILSIMSAICGALYNITTRKVGIRDRAETSLFYVGLVGSLGAALPLPWHWQMPEGMQWLFLVGMGLCGGFGHFMLIQAHRLAPAAALSPFVYTQIVWMTALGFLVFGDVPDLWTIVGAAIVVASGLFVFASERVLGRGGEIAAPLD
ncbi:MAG: DMT family transporter [Hyphomicrobiales bacterium]